MRFGRVALVGGALVAAAAVFSGCVVFTGPATVKQVGKKPKVKVKFEVCMSVPEPEFGCDDSGNSESSSGPGDSRLLIGFRVPKGTKAPQSFEPASVETANPPAGTLVLSRDADYKRELNQKAPRNAKKFKYLGYSSEPIDVPGDTGGFTGSAAFKVKMQVPDNVVGKRFRVRPVVGVYMVNDEQQPATEPIDCGPDPFASEGTGPSETLKICIDSPSADNFTNAKVKIKRKK
jgi:hypothetical protein